ncbi:hypothetical protein [Deinococcus rubellus]|uniref:EamA family transporter n=1 Tax=Deinococcus rubellus TaxID=1889240 RepID=A0ABY5YI85_9DEIO|nr:hypothetical protein [Deinococcus rubellus]UWX64835.1 hypothetical protein N0D28_04000 [Deinococcus rubellus]
MPTEATQMPPFNPRVAVLGLGCALILWLSVSPLVLSISRQLAGKQT